MLPERLRELRTEAGLSQEQLAGILSLHKSTVSLYENGRREPDDDTMQRIAAYFRVSVDYLLGRTDVRQHDGSILRLRKLHADYDPSDRRRAMAYIQEHAAQGELVTGLLFGGYEVSQSELVAEAIHTAASVQSSQPEPVKLDTVVVTAKRLQKA